MSHWLIADGKPVYDEHGKSQAFTSDEANAVEAAKPCTACQKIADREAQS